MKKYGKELRNCGMRFRIAEWNRGIGKKAQRQKAQSEEVKRERD